MQWSLRELRFFVTAAEAGSFTEAAAQLYVSQAAVSRTIAGLEKSVGDRLLRRVPRGCELTGSGTAPTIRPGSSSPPTSIAGLTPSPPVGAWAPPLRPPRTTTCGQE
jgi:regulatory helix-turn-helix LysR family protein